MSSPPSSNELLELARTAAHEGGALLRERFLGTNRARDVTTKSSSTDLVTAADHESERCVVEVLLAARPHDGIIAEESARRDGTSGIEWVIDPLDGTTNFVFGRACFAVSIAAVDEHGTIAGVVYDPIFDETFSATRGGGARLGDEPLRLPVNPTPIPLGLLGTGFSYSPERRALQGRLVGAMLPLVRDIRRAGAAALDLCAIACGRLDAYYEADLRPWDLAAGALIASEAGARLEQIEGLLDATTAVVAHPDVFDELVMLLRSNAAT